MNIIFITMGSFLSVLNDLHQQMKNDFAVVGLYAADKNYFNFYTKKHRITANHFLGEWEIINQARVSRFNPTQLQRIEQEYFQNESVWSALIMDRRLFQGKYCKFKQDYKPAYTYEELLSILCAGVVRIEKFIDSVKPDLILAPTPTTFAEYLFYKIAKQRRIHYKHLRPTKILNYLTLTDDIYEQHEIIKSKFAIYRANNSAIPLTALESATNFVQRAQGSSLTYEGNVPNVKKEFRVIQGMDLPKLIKYGLEDFSYLFRKRDNHHKGSHMLEFLYDQPLRRVKIRRFSKVFRNKLKSLKTITENKYVFYPLHAEPEIALTIFSKHYQNQIEFIRNVAHQLPANTKLLIKEHPRNIGRRNFGYYKKIFEIPNVDMAAYDEPSSNIIKATIMTVVLSGNIGLEAVLCQKPVLTFGKTMINLLPKTMVNHVDNIKDFHQEFAYSLSNYSYCETELCAFIAAIIDSSAPINLYTGLLQKPGREGGVEKSNNEYENSLAQLAGLLRKTIHSVSTNTALKPKNPPTDFL